MKLTKTQQIELSNAIKLMELYDGEMDVKLQYAFAKTQAKLTESLAPYEKVREELIDKLVKKDEAGLPKTEMKAKLNVYVFNDEAAEKDFMTKIKELQAEDDEIEIHQVKMDELKHAYQQSKIPNFMLLWGTFITE